MKYIVIKEFPGYGYTGGEILEEYQKGLFCEFKENQPTIPEEVILKHKDHFKPYVDTTK